MYGPLDNYRTVYDTKYEHVCEDKPSRVCEKHWEEDGKGGKIWVDDPATCKTIYKTECKNEERKVPRREKYQGRNSIQARNTSQKSSRNIPFKQLQGDTSY